MSQPKITSQKPKPGFGRRPELLHADVFPAQGGVHIEGAQLDAPDVIVLEPPPDGLAVHHSATHTDLMLVYCSSA
jgi:hypothetical protein